MEELEGSRLGSTLHLYKGFLYVKNKERNNVVYLRCRNMKCSVAASVHLPRTVNSRTEVFIKGIHKHSPPTKELDWLRMKSELRRAVQRSNKPVRTVFNEVSKKFPNSKLELSSDVKHKLYRFRNMNVPTAEDEEKVDQDEPSNDECSLEMEVKETSGAVETEDGASASTSSVRCPTPEITLQEEQEFGDFERQMSSISSAAMTFAEETPATTQDVDCSKQKEIHTSTITLADIIQTTNASDSTSLVKVKPIDILRPKDTSGKARKSKNKEDIQTSNIDISAKTLESAIQRLETVSDKLTASLVDSYDYFGKYISSVLRGLPKKKVHSLKQKIMSEVLDALAQEESNLSYDVFQQTQATATPNVSSDFRFVPEQSSASNFPSDSKTYSNKVPIRGDLPMLYPGVFNSSPSMKVPQEPITVASVGSATMNEPPPLANITSTNTLPPLLKEAAYKNVLAASAHNPTTSSTVRSDPSSSQSPRGRKRRKTTTADHTIKKTPSRREPSTISFTTSDDEPTSDDQPPGTQPQSLLGITSQLVNSSSSESGGVSTMDQLLKTGERDFEIDIEEGNELARIKEDHDLFETVLCGSQMETSSLYIKEEAPDPEEPPESVASIASPAPATAPATATCHLCNTNWRSTEELDAHLSSAHPGCDVPPADDVTAGGYFNT